MRERICRQCGSKFLGGPRAWYCPDCRIERQKQQNIRYAQNKSAGKSVILGETIRKCERCGAEFIMYSARQKYCPDCRDEAWKESDRQQGLAYYSENKDEINSIRNEKRRSNSSIKRCIVCGKILPDATGGRGTCSDGCRQIRDSYAMAKADYNRGKRKSLPTWNEWLKIKAPRRVGISLVRSDRWIAYINYDGLKYKLGTFRNREDAIAVRERAELSVQNGADICDIYHPVRKRVEVVCSECGKTFLGTNRSIRCPECTREKNKQDTREYIEKNRDAINSRNLRKYYENWGKYSAMHKTDEFREKNKKWAREYMADPEHRRKYREAARKCYYKKRYNKMIADYAAGKIEIEPPASLDEFIEKYITPKKRKSD